MKTKRNIDETMPARGFHPGEDIRDEIDAREELTQGELARNLGMKPSQLNEIIKGKRNITPGLAILLEEALGIDKEYWMNAQKQYDLDKARISKSVQERVLALETWKSLKSCLPVKDFRRQKIITDDPVKDLPELKKIYGTLNTEAIKSQIQEPVAGYYRKSEQLEVNMTNLTGWKQLVKYKASQVKITCEFDNTSANSLVESLHEIFRQNNNTKSKVKALLESYGILMVYQPHFEKTPVDGYSFVSGRNPVIAMSLRHKRIDNFAFTLFHELGHVYLHLLRNLHTEFLDIQDSYRGSDNLEEQEANAFAANHLIPPKSWQSFFERYPRFNDEIIIAFAKKQQVHPAIVFGRLCFETGNYKRRTSIGKVLR